LRQSDALGLKWDQINIEDKIIKDLMIRKNNFVIDIPLTDNAIDALKAWYDKTDNKDKVFPNLKVYKCADRIGELIGDNLFSGHELRNIGLSLKACEI
jgi:integrase